MHAKAPDRIVFIAVKVCRTFQKLPSHRAAVRIQRPGSV